MRKYWLPVFFPFPAMFSKCFLFQGPYKSGLCGNFFRPWFDMRKCSLQRKKSFCYNAFMYIFIFEFISLRPFILPFLNKRYVNFGKKNGVDVRTAGNLKYFSLKGKVHSFLNRLLFVASKFIKFGQIRNCIFWKRGKGYICVTCHNQVFFFIQGEMIFCTTACKLCVCECVY